jgi:hypothetical protein
VDRCLLGRRLVAPVDDDDLWLRALVILSRPKALHELVRKAMLAGGG